MQTTDTRNTLVTTGNPTKFKPAPKIAPLAAMIMALRAEGMDTAAATRRAVEMRKAGLI